MMCGVRIFKPTQCPCGCKKWIMHPMFHCQCSSLSNEEKDEFMDMVRDARRFRALRSKKDMHGQIELDIEADIIIITEVQEKKNATGR